MNKQVDSLLPDKPVEGWLYSGVDYDIPGTGGKACAEYLNLQQRFVESFLASLFGLGAVWLAYTKATLPKRESIASVDHHNRLGKRILLVVMCLTFGIELGFKFATRQVIWIFNPCHLATMIQIYLLAAPPGPWTTAVFRLHMHMLTGAPIALIFPVVNTRLLPFETEVYYIQHILMLIIPFYLMRIGGPYIPEKIKDFSWPFISLGLLFIYHFVPLQILALMTQVNLNNMLCPAISDPFRGKYYRLFAFIHQSILIPTLGKIYVIIAVQTKLIHQSYFNTNEEPAFLSCREDRKNRNNSHANGEVSTKNGHLKST